MLKHLYHYIKNYKVARSIGFIKYHKACKLVESLI